ncbi:MAG: hypothetical protein GF418_06020 [Chitinivibrionales bacterium]|nr:hypothetical protein [Chitinivibrionales bacterium]MBD3395168.1 hypothetical protein [Chitinivibrionales bacterium]
MRHARALVMLAAAGVLAARAEHPCMFADSAWDRARRSRKQDALASPSYESMDAPCFAWFLKRVRNNAGGQSGDPLLHHLDRYLSVKGPPDLALMHQVMTAVPEQESPGLAGALVERWAMHHGRPREVLDAMEEEGAYRRMDSVYGIIDMTGALDVYDLLKWGRVRGILQDYAGAARVFCTASRDEPRIVSMARAQLVQQVLDADTDARGRALDEYRACCLASGVVDTAGLLRWLAHTYARFELFENEIETIVEAAPDSRAAGAQLLLVARRRFSRGRFNEAIAAARPAHRFLGGHPSAKECAVLLYHAFARTGPPDSAIAWFDRADLSDARSVATVVALYQEAGLFSEADSLIRALPPSAARDTLAFRQRIFMNRLQEARDLVLKRTAMRHWARLKDDAVLWKTRTAVYGGDLAAAIGHIDSTSIRPSWEAAHEMLTHKYVTQVFRSAPDAFGTWGRLARVLYAGKPELMLDDTLGRHEPAAVRELFAVTLAEALIRKRFFSEAAAVLSRVPREEATPRVAYFLAESLLMQGEVDRAKSILENLVVEHPHDVFSSKARMYLQGLEADLRM